MQEGTAQQEPAKYSEYRNSPIINIIISLIKRTLDRKFEYHLNCTIAKGFIEARYSNIKVSGHELHFIDSKNTNNRIVIYLDDIAKASVEEDCKNNTTFFKFDLKNGEHINITLSKSNDLEMFA